MLEAVIFDWGGTLTPWKTVDPHDAWRAYAGALHADDADRAAEAARRLAEADLVRWAGVRDEHRAFTIAQVLADAAADHDAAALDAYRDFWVHATHTDPEAAPMLAVLRERGLRLGILSSTPWPAAWHEEWLRRDGVLHLFDACVWSSDLPVTKPHPDAFRAALEAVGVADPARAVYVGDRPYDDVSGAKAVGMRAVLVPHSDIPRHQQVPVDVEPDGVLARLADLPGLIAGW
ncbi:MAG: hydrolase / 5-amino-6-(5-phospho-D-ribitylamino)uracil phosphatase [Pseudonocardiales bacterium]|nr:hydrolase / 5-amino-6-(5-phospho-D-ribitylamino)uracil phosphatase [Pseudonocardiales bacterium]